jgi:hypothetical protein
MRNYLVQRPWIWIYVGFAVVITSLVWMVVVAVHNTPQEVPLRNPTAYAEH